MKKISAIVIALTIASCAPGPDYLRPETAAGKAGEYLNAPEKSGENLELSRWWESMNDPFMDEYVSRLLKQNLDLKQASARIKQAWERRHIQAGALAPTLSASASGQRSFRPASSLAGASSSNTSDRTYNTSIETGLSTSWQVDLFGRIGRSAASAEALAQAAQADKEALTHALVAELARLRVSIAALQEKLRLARDIVNNYERTLEITRNRYRKGSEEVGAAEVHLAENNLASAKASIAPLEQQLNEQAYTLSVLLGEAPGSIDLSEKTMNLEPPRSEVPPGMPAALIDRRPDIKSTELRLISANHDIGVAVADLFPSLSLSGSLGFEDESAKNLFTSERLVGALIGDIMMRLFEGGRLRANIRLQEAEAEELVSAYAQTVLEALQEVETALSNERKIAAQLKELKNSVESISDATTSIQNRYERGVASLLEVLEAQRRLAQAEQSFIEAKQARWNARVSLYLALGGDWKAGEDKT
jgi:NodT family efflux transporter outer membrane factor (OMF) lipoprotein